MHPFAQYIRILGRGKRGSRNLTESEAEQSFRAILAGEATPAQIGAFLMLLRVKEETGEELSGFVRATRAVCGRPATPLEVDIDWPSYAGKRRHLPWFLLSALLCASRGLKVFMHGVEGTQDSRLYTPAALAALGIPAATSMEEARAQLCQRHFAYLGLEHFAPALNKLIRLRDELGLRSPVHSLCRMLNPLGARISAQGIFHPPYRAIHRDAALRLRDHGTTVIIKGEGGEFECNPDGDCPATFVSREGTEEQTLTACFRTRHLKEPALDARVLRDVWHGRTAHEYGEAAVITTAALVLKALRPRESLQHARDTARQWWDTRDRAFLN